MEETERPRIHTSFRVHDLIGDSTGIDARISVANFTYQLTRAINAVYPEEEVAFYIGYEWSGGDEPGTFQTEASGFADDAAVVTRVNEIARQVRESGDWVVRE